ncbi:MAG: uncharacterized protein KVP18_003112 [Porospora cf. gigantea A]|uniref:uncharacterized protein n=1 Tax=Porospora cf. gigantea A TaxID=2853593 RepID=UPI00355A2C2F|nr:MAG: hypothetical protein KVP18_003112 [Porospora cf. gigantea A]
MDSKPVSDCLPSHQKENRFDEIQKRLKDGTNNVKSFLSKTIINSMRSCDAKDMTVEQHEMTFTPATPNKGNGSIRPIAFHDRKQLDGHVAPETWGHHDFDFQLDLLEGAQLQCSARHKASKAEIPIRCIWKRKLGGLMLNIPLTDGSASYLLTADDIGATVFVEANPTAKGVSGTAFGSLGPFELDAVSRQSLEGYLSLGSVSFPLDGSKETASCPGLSIDREGVRVTRQHRNTVLTDVEHAFGTHYPMVELVQQSPTRFTLTLGASEDDRHGFTALSRQQRDLIALTVRCFKTSKYIGHSALIELVMRQNREVTRDSESDMSVALQEAEDFNAEGELLDVFALTERLSFELVKFVKKCEESELALERVTREKENLEIDVNATINAYRDLLASEGDKGVPAPDEDLAKRAAEKAELETKLTAANKMLEKYIGELEHQRNQYRLLNERHAQQAREMSELTLNETRRLDDSVQVQHLQEQVERLRKQFTATSKRETEQSVKLKELNAEMGKLKRLKADPTTRREQERHDLQKDNMGLTHKLRALECERKEIQENFMYTKARLDEQVAEKNDVLRSKETLERKLDEAERRLKEEKRVNLDCSQREERGLRSQIDDLSQEAEALRKDNTSLRSKLRKLATST